jgi:hypothetical protein
MWATLQSVHLQKRPATRFNALDGLFSIRKLEDETVNALITRIDHAMNRVQDLHPTKFTIDDMDGTGCYGTP